MRKLCIFVLGLMVTGGIALAQAPTARPPVEAPTLVEAAVIDGGENARNGAGDGAGVEVVGIFGFAQVWYAGGILGRYEQDLDGGGDIESLYLNLKIGRVFSVAPRTISYLEGGLWFGDQDTDGPGPDTDPRALELKVGFVHSVSEKVDFLGSLSWVHADLDTDPDDDDLRNYVWSAGVGYNFTEMFSMNLRVIDGFNGVNGQDQVLRLAARWTF
jgi:Outer membrane protein beta-barrel domain